MWLKKVWKLLKFELWFGGCCVNGGCVSPCRFLTMTLDSRMISWAQHTCIWSHWSIKGLFFSFFNSFLPLLLQMYHFLHFCTLTPLTKLSIIPSSLIMNCCYGSCFQYWLSKEDTRRCLWVIESWNLLFYHRLPWHTAQLTLCIRVSTKYSLLSPSSGKFWHFN